MSLPLSSRTFAGLVGQSLRRQTNIRPQLGLVRFLSKKSDEGGEEAITSSKKSLSSPFTKRGSSDVPRALKAKTQSKKKQEENEDASNSKFLSFDKLPKPPKEILDMPLDQFYAKVYMRDLPVRPQIDPSNKFLYKFEVPSRFVRHKHHEFPALQEEKSKNNNPEKQQTSSFEPANNILEFKVDYNTNSLVRVPEHPLKESITGMFVSNPLMHNLDNDFLWDMYPRGKAYGNVPFGGDKSFDGFKNWENKENDKVKQKESQFETKVKEVNEFRETLSESKSFYRKQTNAAPTEKQEENTTAKAGGRRKLDRGLLKQYRKYKKEGLFKKRFNNDGNKNNNF